MIALDTHDDINAADFTPERNYTQDLGNQVNLPKMVAGGLDASFFIVYVGQGPLTPEGYDNAYKQAVAKFDAIHLLTEKIAPDKIELALTAADVRRINKAGKKVALIGVENGYSLGDASTAVKRVKEFHDRGARYLSLAHNGHSQLADSNTGEASGEWMHNGLSELGKQVIAEMNRVGIMVDLSHPSKPSNMQAIALSKAPVIASHSAARALCDHSRDLDDELLLAIKKNGGVVQTVAFASYVKTPPPPTAERLAALDQARRRVRPARRQRRTGRARRRPWTRRGSRCAAGSLRPAAAARPRLRVRVADADGAARWRSCPTTSARRPKSGSPRSTSSFPRRRGRTSRTSSITSTTSSRRSASITSASRRTSTAAAASTAGTTRARRSTSRSSSSGAATPRMQIGKIWSGNLLRVMEEVRQVASGCRSSASAARACSRLGMSLSMILNRLIRDQNALSEPRDREMRAAISAALSSPPDHLDPEST